MDKLSIHWRDCMKWFITWIYYCFEDSRIWDNTHTLAYLLSFARLRHPLAAYFQANLNSPYCDMRLVLENIHNSTKYLFSTLIFPFIYSFLHRPCLVILNFLQPEDPANSLCVLPTDFVLVNNVSWILLSAIDTERKQSSTVIVSESLWNWYFLLTKLHCHSWRYIFLQLLYVL